MIDKPGVYPDLSEQEYHADPCPEPSLSSGIMNRLITSSPLHAWHHHPRLNPDAVPQETEDQLERGQLAHCLLVGAVGKVVTVNPKDFPAEKTGNIPDGWTNKAIRAERDRIREAGNIPVFVEAYEQALEMAGAARSALLECEIGIDLKDGQGEVTFVWQDDGVWCRSRTDWWGQSVNIMLDYKSTAGLAHPDAWTRTALVQMGYDIQAAHYRRGAHLLTGQQPHWLFLVQENYPPFACSIIGLSEAQWEIAEGRRRLAFELWRKHRKLGQWPGYGNRIAYATPSTWQMERHEQALEELFELGSQA